MKASMKKDEVENKKMSMTITINAAWPLALRVDVQGAGIEKKVFYAKHDASPIEHKSAWRTPSFRVYILEQDQVLLSLGRSSEKSLRGVPMRL